MAEDTQEPLTQDPPSKASKLYNNLLSDGYTPKNLGSEEEFTSALSDPSKAAKIYNGLLGDGYTVKNLGGMDDFLNTFTKNTAVSERPSSYPIKTGFAANINMGEAQKPLPVNLHPAPEQTEQQPEAPSIENNFGFNHTAQQNVADNTANVAPQQSLEKVDFDVNHVQRVKQQEQYTNQAIDNATAKALKLKGINAQPGSVQYNQQRNEFVKQVQNGDATVNTKNGEAGLERTTGFLENIKNGWNEATTGADEADDFANKMTAQERVDYLNKKQSEQKPSAYIGEQPNLLGSTGHLIGSSVPFLAKAGAGAVIGAGAVAATPESMGASLAGLPTAMSFMLTAPDMVNQGVQQEVSRRYQILKHEHPERSDIENMEEAGKGALVGGVGGILENAALMRTGMNTPILSESKSLIGQTVNKIINSGVHLGTVSAGITAAEQELGNLQGIKTSQSDILKNSIESFKEGATTGAALTALMHVPQMPKILKSVFKDAIVRNENPQTVANVLQANENVGNIPQGTTQKVTGDLNGYREALGKIPDGLSTESQSSIAGLIQKKNNLIEESKTKDDSFKDFYKQKTDAIDQQIADIQRTGKPFEHEIDEATGKPYEQPTYDEVAQQRVQELAKKISKNADISDPQSIQTQQNFPEQLKTELQNIADVEKKNNEGKENPNTEVADNAENFIKKNLSKEEIPEIPDENIKPKSVNEVQNTSSILGSNNDLNGDSKKAFQLIKEEWNKKDEQSSANTAQSNPSKKDASSAVSHSNESSFLRDDVITDAQNELKDAADGKIQITPERASDLLEKINEPITHKRVVKNAIEKGKYQKAIDEGSMTADDAKKIIESAGLEVPKDILEKANEEPKEVAISSSKENGKEIEPHMEVSASKQVAIKEVAEKHGLKPMEASMLHGLKGKNVDEEFTNEPGLKQTMFKKLEEKGFFDYNDEGQRILSDKANEFINAADARHETRKNVKSGSDLFPSEANIPEIKLNKSEERVAKDQIKKSDADKIIEDEGLSPENIKDYEHLFNGFPFTREDLKNIKNSFNEKRPITEPAADRQPNIGNDENKIISDEGPEISRPETAAFKKRAQIATSLEEANHKPVSVHEVAKFISKVFDVPIRKGMIRMRDALGIYKRTPEVIRLRNTNDMGTLMHEVAHHIDKKNFGKNFPFKEELKGLDYDQNKHRPFEGFAEFVRMWMTGEGDLTSRASKFLNYWENDFMKKEGDLQTNIKQVKQYVDIWRQQGAMLRVLGTFDKQETPENNSTFNKNVTRRAQWDDVNYPLKAFVNKILEYKGIDRKSYESDPVWKGKDPYLLASVVVKTAGAKARSWVMDGLSDFAGNKVGKSLKEVIEPVKKEIYQAVAYTVSLRRLGRAKKGVEYTKNDIEDAEYIVDYYKNNEEVKNFAKEVTEWNSHVIDYLVDAGRLSDESKQKILDSDAFYMPLKALTDQFVRQGIKSRSLSNTAAAVRRFSDTGGNIVDPLEAMIHNTERMIAIADKSRVVNAMLDMADGVDGIGKLIEQVPAPIQTMTGSIETIKNQLEQAGLDIQGADLDSLITMFAAGGKTSNLPENIVALYRNGKLKYYQVDPVLYKSIAGLDPVLMDFMSRTKVGKLLVFATKTLRVGATGARAGFQLVSNPFRDLFTGIMQTQGRAIDVPLGNIKAIKEVIQGESRSDIMRRYKASGVEMAQPLGMDRRSTQNLVNEAIADPAKRKLMNIALHPIEALGKVYDAYIEAVSFPENIPRIREYKLIFNKYNKLIDEAKAQGDFKKVKELETARQVDATNAANEVTLNFKKAGIYAATINQFAFGFNPAVRGLSKMSSLLKNSPARTITRGIVSLTLPTIALYLMQKDEDWYKNLPEWEKEGFFHFKIGEKIIRLPRPFEWGWAFSNIPEAIMNSYNEDDLSKMKEVLTSGQNVLPNVPIPDLVKPSLEAYFNWDLFKSRAITPRSEVDLLPELQYGRNTSPTAKKLGEILGVSPRNIDHILSGYTGGMASDILTALPKEYKESADIPVIGRLFVRKSSYVESGQYTQDFYSDYDRARKIKISQNKIKSGAKDGELSLSKEDEFLIKDRKEIDRNVKQLKYLRDKYVQVEGSDIEKELKEKSLDAIAYAQYLVVKDYFESKHNYLKENK